MERLAPHVTSRRLLHLVAEPEPERQGGDARQVVATITRSETCGATL